MNGMIKKNPNNQNSMMNRTKNASNRTPSIITGFHVHPKHTTNYLHMHVICNNENMIAKTAFGRETDPEKFVRTDIVLKSLKGNSTNERKNIGSIKILNNVLTSNMKTFNNNSRLPGKVLYVDNKCFVINNRDRAAIGNKNQKKGRGWGSTSKVHILVCPIKRIYNCLTLTENDVELVKHMRTVGETIAKMYASESMFNKKSNQLPALGQANIVYGMPLNAFAQKRDEFKIYMDTLSKTLSKTLSALKLNGNKTLLNGSKENLHFFENKFNKIISTLKRRQPRMESNGMSRFNRQ